ASLRRTAAPAPFHLATTLATYDVLSVVDRMRVAAGALAIRTLDPQDPELDDISFGTWLGRHGQNNATIAALWNLITVAALNSDVDHASLALATKVFRTGLLDSTDAADIGVPERPLDALHVQPALDFLATRGADIQHNSTVRSVIPENGSFTLRLDDAELSADSVVVAVPPDTAAAMCPTAAGLAPQRLRSLGAAPIVNVHVVFERPVTDTRFVAVLSSPVQFVFDRTAPAGLGH